MDRYLPVLALAAAVGWLWLVPKLTRPDGARRTAVELGLRRGEEEYLQFRYSGSVGIGTTSGQKYLRAPDGVSGKVMAVSDQYNVAVLSVGKSDGVKVGDRFVIRRGATDCAVGVVDKLEQDWCAVQWSNARQKVQVGDDAIWVCVMGGR
jgi:hypothetical protein